MCIFFFDYFSRNIYKQIIFFFLKYFYNQFLFIYLAIFQQINYLVKRDKNISV